MQLNIRRYKTTVQRYFLFHLSTLISSSAAAIVRNSSSRLAHNVIRMILDASSQTERLRRLQRHTWSVVNDRIKCFKLKRVMNRFAESDSQVSTECLNLISVDSYFGQRFQRISKCHNVFFLSSFLPSFLPLAVPPPPSALFGMCA
jgi:hypothetical protein